MKKVFSIHNSEYTPISFRNRYLYDSYNQITSFLQGKLSSNDLKRLLKPVLQDNGEIGWYSSSETILYKLEELDDKTTEIIKTEFHSFLSRTNEISTFLKSSQDKDKKEWGLMIDSLFNADKIILLGNSDNEWAMLWGWDFQKYNENKLPYKPSPPKVAQSTEDASKSETASKSGNSAEGKQYTEPTPSQNQNNNSDNIDNKDNMGPTVTPITEKAQVIDPAYNLSRRQGCFGWIKRILRWISYRFWGLFWLIIYTLFVILLCKHFFKPDCSGYIKQLEHSRIELEKLEQHIRERCDSLETH